MGVDMSANSATVSASAAVGDEDDAALVDVDEQRDVVVAALGGGLVDATRLHVGEIEPRQRGFDVVMMTRHSRVSCSPTRRAAAATGMCVTSVMASASNSSVKPEPGLRPRHGDLLDAAVGAGDARRPGVQERLMLEEVEMPPLLHRRCRARGSRPCRSAGMGSGRLGEVDLDVERASAASNAHALTIHGGTSPRASWNRSVSRMNWHSVARGASILPTCSRPSRRGLEALEPAAPSACRPVLTTAPRDGVLERQVGAEGWSPIEQRDGTGSPRIKPIERASPTQNSEEAKKGALEEALRRRTLRRSNHLHTLFWRLFRSFAVMQSEFCFRWFVVWNRLR